MQYIKDDILYEILACEYQGVTKKNIDGNTFIVDTGNNNVENGCYDNHGKDHGAESTAELVFIRRKDVRLRIENCINSDLNNQNRIKILVHANPDFDCVVSAWLISEIGKHGEKAVLRPGTISLVKYASNVDQGRLSISIGRTYTPAIIFRAFEKTYNPSIHGDSRTEYILSRGFVLIDKFLEYASSQGLDDLLKDKTIEEVSGILDTVFFEYSEFLKEYEIIDDDRNKYFNDKKKNCIAIDDFRVFKKGGCAQNCNVNDYCQECTENRIDTCKALIWIKEPSCFMHKDWARSEGYVLTFIPDNPQYANEKDNSRYFEFPGGKYLKTKVIISVNPKSGYCLRNLAIALETMECFKEEQLLGSYVNLKRSRAMVRGGYEDEGWVTNVDPWYDGGKFGYTIIDAPYSGSLLSVEEILEAAMHYTERSITNGTIKTIVPFVYGELEKYEQVFECINSTESDHGKMFEAITSPDKTSFGKEIGSYLRTHVKDYFAGLSPISGKHKTKPVMWFRVNKKLNIENCSEGDVYMVLFNTGVGFMISEHSITYFEKNNSKNDGLIKDTLNTLRDSITSFYDVEMKKNNSKQFDFKFLKPSFFIYCGVNNLYFNYMNGANNITNRILNSIDEIFDFNKEEKGLINGEKLTFGLSGNCNIMVENVAFDEGTDTSTLIDSFFNEWMLEYLLALYQTEALLNFRQLIGLSPKYKDFKKISYLREQYVDFLAHGYYANVTNDAFGARLYSGWQGFLKTEKIKEEVNEQLEALDDIASRKFEKNISLFSNIMLPVSIALTAVQAICAFIGLKSGVALGIGVTIGISIISAVPGCIYYFRK